VPYESHLADALQDGHSAGGEPRPGRRVRKPGSTIGPPLPFMCAPRGQAASRGSLQATAEVMRALWSFLHLAVCCLFQLFRFDTSPLPTAA
jgi:hypothetical protein